MDNNLIHNLDEKPTSDGFSYGKFFIFVGIAVVLGSALGFGLTKLQKKGESVNLSSAQAEKTVGIVDKETFKSTAEGILREGGVDGEGSFHLERTGGESQNAYLTSSAVDLSQFIGKKIKVWGQTFQGEKAGWLMDVGLVEILK